MSPTEDLRKEGDEERVGTIEPVIIAMAIIVPLAVKNRQPVIAINRVVVRESTILSEPVVSIEQLSEKLAASNREGKEGDEEQVGIIKIGRAHV